MRHSIIPLLLAFTAATLHAQTTAEPATSKNNERLRKGLAAYPEADTNKDGVLTMEEGLAFLAKMKKKTAAPEAKKTVGGPAPTFADVAYGPHERNKLDFWKAKADKPAPVVVFIHGGGFVAGDKSRWQGTPELKQLLDKGVSCAAINYRYLTQAPVQDILHDAAHAVQFVRSKGSEWNIDKTRIAAQGGSAGAGTSLWLATRDDLADATASDPVLRESSRVCAAVINSTQATYDLTRWESFLGPANPAWFKSPDEGALFYGFKKLDDLQTQAAKVVLHECDMLSWISKEDAPILCTTGQPDGPIQNRGQWLHHPKHAREVKKCCDACAVECTIIADGAAKGENPALHFLLTHLQAAGE
ncbi:MAG: alpha/beta hydrolase [Verrucomicrobiaceae bacterium]|nr:alpha/beta hydrolase [Verrucomicrobiaceae bacterium]